MRSPVQRQCGGGSQCSAVRRSGGGRKLHAVVRRGLLAPRQRHGHVPSYRGRCVEDLLVHAGYDVELAACRCMAAPRLISFLPGMACSNVHGGESTRRRDDHLRQRLVRHAVPALVAPARSGAVQQQPGRPRSHVPRRGRLAQLRRAPLPQRWYVAATPPFLSNRGLPPPRALTHLTSVALARTGTCGCGSLARCGANNACSCSAGYTFILATRSCQLCMCPITVGMHGSWPAHDEYGNDVNLLARSGRADSQRRSERHGARAIFDAGSERCCERQRGRPVCLGQQHQRRLVHALHDPCGGRAGMLFSPAAYVVGRAAGNIWPQTNTQARSTPRRQAGGSFAFTANWAASAFATRAQCSRLFLARLSPGARAAVPVGLTLGMHPCPW
jgi:hypothetical protein